MTAETLHHSPSLEEMPPLVTTEELAAEESQNSELEALANATPEEIEFMELLERVGPEAGAIIMAQAVELEEVKKENAELKRDNAKLYAEARLDEKTGLPNVRDMKEWLTERIEEQAENLWVGFIDMDGLKQMNDVHGHKLGDEAIQHLADTLQDKVREIIEANTRLGTDAKPARIGGDEFLFAVNGASAERIAEISKRILEGINSMGITADGRLVDMNEVEVGATPVGASIGFAKHKPGENAEDTIEEADHNMYIAKRGDGATRENSTGRGGMKNRVVIDGQLAA